MEQLLAFVIGLIVGGIITTLFYKVRSGKKVSGGGGNSSEPSDEMNKRH